MTAQHPRHASRRPRVVGITVPIGLLFTAAASLVALAAVPVASGVDDLPAPAAAMMLPDVHVAAERAADPCADEQVRAALADGDDAATVRAFGGGEACRAAVGAGNAPCISLSDPARTWVVVNKLRPLRPESYAPASLIGAAVASTTRSNELRPVATAAL